MKISSLILAAFILAVTPSCHKTPKEDPAPASMTLSSSSASAGVDGENLQVNITSPAKPRAVSDVSWITVSEGPFSSYKQTVSVKVEANPTHGERTGTVTFTCSPSGQTLSATLTVKQAGKDKKQRPKADGTPGWVMAEKIGFGWNMGNQMDAYNNGVADETCWTGVTATEKLFTSLKAKGVKTVRIPVTWLGHFGEAPDYKIDNRLDRVAELVGWAEKAGLNAIVNIHHDGAENKFWLDIAGASKDKTLRDDISAQVEAIWTQIAERFKDKGDFLIFESFNEINDGGWGWSSDYITAEGKKRQNACLDEWNQVFVDAVRATGGNNSTRWLGIPGYCADPTFTMEGMTLPKDSAEGRLMVAVHYYAPWEFTLNCSANDWGHTRKNNLNKTEFDEVAMESMFEKMYNKWVAKGIPCYLGEFGCSMRADAKEKAFQMYYLEYLAKCATTYGMGAMLWDNNSKGTGEESHGYIDNASGEWIGYAEEVFGVLNRAFYSKDSSYAIETVYDSAP